MIWKSHFNENIYNYILTSICLIEISQNNLIWILHLARLKRTIALTCHGSPTIFNKGHSIGECNFKNINKFSFQIGFIENNLVSYSDNHRCLKWNFICDIDSCCIIKYGSLKVKEIWCLKYKIRKLCHLHIVSKHWMIFLVVEYLYFIFLFVQFFQKRLRIDQTAHSYLIFIIDISA